MHEECRHHANFLLASHSVCNAGEEQVKLSSALSSFRTEYSLAPDHKAFAQSEEGAWAWSANMASTRDAIDNAIARCTKNLKPHQGPCLAIHVDDKWIPVPPPNPQKIAADIQAKRLRAEQRGVLTLTDENIEKTIRASKGRLAVQFSSYNRGCGYCVIAHDPYEKLVSNYPGIARFARITWEPWRSMNQEVINNYKLYGLPAVIVFNDGKEEFRVFGWSPALEEEIREKLDLCCAR